MRVLMVGVDKQTKGGMWTVAENYIQSNSFVAETNLQYVATSITGSVPKRLLFTAKALLQIGWKLIRNRFDIAHIHMAERGSVYRKNLVICMAKLFGCKIIIHMHGAEFETWYRSLASKKQQGVRKILSKADRILILGEYWREFVCSLVSNQEDVRVLHNAVQVPDENPYDPEARNILFLGVVGKRKGVADLLEAMKRIDDKLPKTDHLMVYGPENDIAIEDAIAEAGLTSRVEYKGWLTAENKAAVFCKTALNVLPSYNEGLPMTILETMAYGIPNISTNVAAIPEAVTAENGAVICPGDVDCLASEILTLMQDPESRIQKSQIAYKNAKEAFSIDKHIERLLKLYRELV